MDKKKTEYLEVAPELKNEDNLKKQLQDLGLDLGNSKADSALKELEATFGSVPSVEEYETETNIVQPVSAFCVKTHDSNNKKIFFNVCTTSEIPEPRDITEAELAEILESEEASSYRVPMNLGEEHAEVDKSGVACTAYDIAINDRFAEKLNKSALFKTFLVTIMIEGIEEKYSKNFDKNGWIILKNKKYLGSIKDILIKGKKKPLIQELSKNSDSSQSVQTQKPTMSEPLISEVSSRILKQEFTVPPYKLATFVADSGICYFIGRLSLPEVDTVRDITIDISEDRLVVKQKNSSTLLDVFLPVLLNVEESGAEFNHQSKILTIVVRIKS